MHKIIIAVLALAVLSGCVSAAQQKREAAKERAEVVFQLGNECVQQHGLSKETDAHADCVRRLRHFVPTQGQEDPFFIFCLGETNEKKRRKERRLSID